MKRLLLASLAVICIGLGLSIAQTINKSVQLSLDPSGLIGFSSRNSIFIPNKVHGNASATPSIAGAGTTPTITGTDLAGEIQEGTGAVTGPTLTFAQAYTATPYCTGVGSSATSPVAFTVSPNGISVSHNESAARLRWYYTCIGARAG